MRAQLPRIIATCLALVLVFGFTLDSDARRRKRRRRRTRRPAVKGLVLAKTPAGRTGKRIRRGLRRGLRRAGLKLVSSRAHRGKDLGALQGLCAKTEGCKAVIALESSRKRRRYALLSVAWAPNTSTGTRGPRIGEAKGRARSARRLGRTAARLGRTLAKAIIAYVPPAPPPPPKPEPQPEPRPEPRPEPIVTLPVEPTPSVTRRSDPSEAFVIADVAFGLSTRTLELQGLGGQPDIRRHEGGAFAELALRGELYPAALFTRSFAQHIGLVLDFAHHVTMQTRAEAPATIGGAEANVDGSSLLLAGALRLRLPLGPQRLGPALVFAEAGLGMRTFGLGDNAALPEMSYRFLRFALGGEIAFLEGLLRFSLSADIRPFLGVGQETVNALGDRDGGLAFAIGGRVGGQLGFGLRYFVGVEFSHYSVSFQGLGGTSRPPLPGTLERSAPSDASDSYLRVFSGLGYAY